jgi:hypothetical protein
MEEQNTAMSRREKLANFWYYYKWHTLVAIFIIIVLLICTLQMCSKESYDVHIMYAGTHEFKRTSQDGDLPPYIDAISSLKTVTDDYNADGSTTLDFLDLYLMTMREMQDMGGDEGTEVNYALINNNRETFKNNLLYSDYYVCFVSVSLYDEYKLVSDTNIFTDLKKYVESDESPLVFYENEAVYLSSTKLASLPEFSSLPEDTLVTLRIKSAVASIFSKSETEKIYQNSEDVIRNILN